MTWSAVASPLGKIHVIQNVSVEENKSIIQALKRMGYAPTLKPLFSETDKVVIITKTLEHDMVPASITLELVSFTNKRDIPHTIYRNTLPGNNVSDIMATFPSQSVQLTSH